MTHRDLNSIAEKLGAFMIESQACRTAAQNLGWGVEIGVTVGDQIECAFFRMADGAGFELRPPKNPDVTFYLSPGAVDVLCAQTGKSLGELGIEVLKQYLAKEVRIKVSGHLFSILKNGYLGIIKDAGMPFAKFLAEHGVSSLSKVPDIIKKLRDKKG